MAGPWVCLLRTPHVGLTRAAWTDPLDSHRLTPQPRRSPRRLRRVPPLRKGGIEKQGGRSRPVFWYPLDAVGELLQQLQHALGHLVCLGQHGLGRLDEDVVLGVSHHLVGHVGVADGGLGVLDVLFHDGQVVDGVV